MAYGTADEALSLFLWLKIGSAELSQEWDKSMYKNKLLPCTSISISSFPIWSLISKHCSEFT